MFIEESETQTASGQRAWDRIRDTMASDCAYPLELSGVPTINTSLNCAVSPKNEMA
jgi:hypothetical protein